MDGGNNLISVDFIYLFDAIHAGCGKRKSHNNYM